MIQRSLAKDYNLMLRAEEIIKRILTNDSRRDVVEATFVKQLNKVFSGISSNPFGDVISTKQKKNAEISLSNFRILMKFRTNFHQGFFAVGEAFSRYESLHKTRKIEKCLKEI